MKKATAAEMRRIEKLAVEAGDSEQQLMERAGRAAAGRIAQLSPDGDAVILCGKGNNGGDGFVISRCLSLHRPVTVILTLGAPKTAAAQAAFAALPERVSVLDYSAEPYICHSAVRDAALLVDCIYGIGFHGELPSRLLPLLEQMALAKAMKYAVDLPSGVSADRAEAAAATPTATLTLTMTAEKVGCAAPQCGRVEVLDIGIPPEMVAQVLADESNAFSKEITADFVQRCLPLRPADSHKGDYGRLLLFCGSVGMAGAAILCGRGALRCGAGLVKFAIPASLYPILAPALPEATFCLLPEEAPGVLSSRADALLLKEAAAADAVVAGCGLGRSPQAAAMIAALWLHCPCPLVLDADGINAVSPHMLLAETAAPRILTPHPGEIAHLLNISVSSVQAHRPELARRFAEEYGVTLVLKGHHTLIGAPGQPLRMNKTGNPGMATGGSGDVLAGMIGSLLGQGLSPWDAAACGAWLHGAAGDAAAARLSQRAMLPSDLLDALGDLFLKFEK